MNFFNVFGEHLISMNVPTSKEEGSYTLLVKSGRKLCLLIGLRKIPFTLLEEM
jgi:hypothetical protein